MRADPDSIAAIATPAGAGGVGVLRVSGPAAPAIARTLLGFMPQPRHAHYAAFLGGDGVPIERGLALYFAAPASYTGEDVLELHAHGSPVVLDLLLRRVLDLGARRARPGEFTERAFLNGKLDLAQAEAVADLIAARSESAARAAQRALAGAFSQRVHSLVAALTALRVQVEAAIDFVDEELELLGDPALAAGLATARDAVAVLIADASHGVRLARGARAVLIGRPNTGKSSLLNALAGEERAIVTATPGTTRDTLPVELLLDGVSVELVDTAGLRDSADAIEQEGVRRARAALARCDLAVLVSETAHVEADLALLDGLPGGAAALVVVNKCDLLADPAARVETRAGRTWMHLSARTGSGLDDLRAELARHAGAGSEECAFTARQRHVEALQQADTALAAAATALAAQRSPELIAEDLRRAAQALGTITGVVNTDDLLGAIFAGFCIGK